MNTNSASASNRWFYSNQLIVPVPSRNVTVTTGTKVIMPLPDRSATMTRQRFMIGTAGSIAMFNLTPRTNFVDPEEMVIARMSTKELLAEVRASAGLWADRDDVEEFILSGRKDDRLEENYASYFEDPDKAV